MPHAEARSEAAGQQPLPEAPQERAGRTQGDELHHERPEAARPHQGGAGRGGCLRREARRRQAGQGRHGRRWQGTGIRRNNR